MNNIINGMKYFLTDFRYNMKNNTIASNARIAIQARDHVDKINNQNTITGAIWSFLLLFFKKPSINTGKNAINQNQKLVGLSNKN